MMKKYNIEGNINFFEELEKDLEQVENNSERCLITNETLCDRFIEMNCGHKFNYLPLLYDIKNFKLKFNSMEGIYSRLKLDEIRCPYCRKKQKGVLPYYEDLFSEKINGVNYLDPSKPISNNVMTYNKCCFIIPNPYYDSTKPTDILNPINTETMLCNNYASNINAFHKGHFTNFGDTNYYCWIHKKIMIKKHKKDLLDKEKEAKKLEKQKLKEAEKQKKMEEKQKLKDDKKLLKNPKIISETQKNLVLNIENLENEVIINNIGCLQLLKSGENKGKQCGCKVLFNNSNMCKRHYNLQLKNEL